MTAKYEPKPGDWVRVVKCAYDSEEHTGKVGRVKAPHGGGMAEVGFDDGTLSCSADVIEPVAPPASEVYARAECACQGKDASAAADKVIAEMRSERLIALDQITTKLLDLMATVHGLRVEVQDRLRGEQLTQKEGEME